MPGGFSLFITLHVLRYFHLPTSHFSGFLSSPLLSLLLLNHFPNFLSSSLLFFPSFYPILFRFSPCALLILPVLLPRRPLAHPVLFLLPIPLSSSSYPYLLSRLSSLHYFILLFHLYLSVRPSLLLTSSIHTCPPLSFLLFSFLPPAPSFSRSPPSPDLLPSAPSFSRSPPTLVPSFSRSPPTPAVLTAGHASRRFPSPVRDLVTSGDSHFRQHRYIITDSVCMYVCLL